MNLVFHNSLDPIANLDQENLNPVVVNIVVIRRKVVRKKVMTPYKIEMSSPSLKGWEFSRKREAYGFFSNN